MTKADNMTGIWMHFMHLSFLLEMSNATVSKSLISTGHLQMMKEQNVLLLHLWTSTWFYSIHPQPSCWMRHSLTPHWSLCSNTAPELNRHPLKHCISARGQEHTHAHRVSIYLIFNVKSMLRRSFCLLQLLEKKDVQYPQLAISDISKIRWGKSVWESPSYDHLNNFPLQSSWLFLDSLLFFWNISEFSHVLHGTQMHSKNQPSYVWYQSFYFFTL